MAPVTDELVSETDLDDVEDENDENTPINDENAFSHTTYAPVHRSSSVLALRTPISHSRTDHDTALRDITDQFFHPPSPSPVRVSLTKPKRSAPYPTEPPRRPKKPKSLAYPADPPNWLHSRSSSTLPPSSPLPPSTNVDHAHFTDRSVGAPTTAPYEYHLGTPSRSSDPDPFGFVAAERALKVTRLRVPQKPASCITAVKSPPRSTVLPPAPSQSPVFASFSQLDAPVPTNNEDIDGLYTDEPVAGPSHAHVSAAPLLMMHSDQPFAELDVTSSQPTFPDPLRTPRKRIRRASPTPDGDPDSDSNGTSIPSSPSPVKVSVGMTVNRPGTAQLSHSSVLKVTRAQSRVVGMSKVPPAHASGTKRVKKSFQDIPTPSSTASARRSSRHSTAPSTPVPPRRSTRQAAVGARAKLNGTTNGGEDGYGGGRMKLRSRSRDTKVATKTKTTKSTARLAKSKTQGRTQKATTTTTVKPARGRPRGKASAKDSKGKGKARPLESVLDLSDDTREKYEKERRERLEYFKRLEGYQIQKENVYVV